ncbi:MAG: hypothetical protein VKJ24_19750 [Synechococcales bacterium]|nr:hypothetical protein [Synechococcales bacterium]
MGIGVWGDRVETFRRNVSTTGHGEFWILDFGFWGAIAEISRLGKQKLVDLGGGIAPFLRKCVRISFQ